jgi:hypothetical protein
MQLLLFLMLAVGEAKPQAPAAPFPYVWAKAFHVPPETTTEESGYFSLCEGHHLRHDNLPVHAAED